MLVNLIYEHYITSYFVTMLLYVTIESLINDIRKTTKKQGKPAVL